MHTYRKQPGDMVHDDKWIVGYYTMEVKYNAMMAAGGSWSPMGGAAEGGPAVVSVWNLLSEHVSEEDAIDRVNYLNGGAVVV